LGNEDASDTGLVTCQIPQISAPGPHRVKSSPVAAAQPPDYVRSVSPRAVCDMSTSFPDRSSSGGVNLMSRTTKDIILTSRTSKDVVKVTAAPQRLCVARASSFTTADCAERTQRRGSKLVHQSSSIYPRSLKMSSADSLYQRSPSIIPTTPQGRHHCVSHSLQMLVIRYTCQELEKHDFSCYLIEFAV